MIPAKIASYLFHPLFMTLLGVFLIFNSGIYSYHIPMQFSRFVYMMVFIFNILLPLGIVSILIFLKIIKNEVIDQQQERLIPLILTTICFYACYYVVSKFSPSLIINYFLGSSVVVIAIVLLITVFWKISMHMAGIGGIAGLALFLMYFYHVDLVLILCATILISGIIFTARLALGSHSLLQLITGYILGILLVFGYLMKVMP